MSSSITETAGVFGRLWQKTFKSDKSCNSKWISFNAQGLRADLESKLFGQHIASPIILKAVTGFMNDDKPEKPLVLSLHGPTGTGKNFVSKLIADNIYKKGSGSSFVHVFASQLHFPHLSQVDSYKLHLQQWIKGNGTSCERSMLIFDGMDQMRPRLIDGIVPYLKDYNKLVEVSYKKAIFIFLSNAGWGIITKTALNFWKEGRHQEFERKNLEIEISEAVLNNDVFWYSSLIKKNLGGIFVPFLPLQYQHVVQCAEAAMKNRGLQLDWDEVDKMASDLDYFPKFEKAFSVRG
ncbi:torsin-1A-like [Anabas testudineus]|uniref:torsin-1A-like n=1 Tax=Anabas testudineus TaxID=64144 RepID=UPI000E4633B1|nr:torsin-1A-like [Anabas testudineus]